MAKNDSNVMIEGARIVFRNFSGKEGPYNREGDRNFAVLLAPELAEAMKEDGWNVKYLKPREEEDEPQAYVSVSVGYNNKARPPLVVMITSRGRTNLDESTIEMLDWADIRNVDLIIRPYFYSVRETSGVKAYLQSIYVTIEEDALALKYSDVDPVGARTTPERFDD